MLLQYMLCMIFNMHLPTQKSRTLLLPFFSIIDPLHSSSTFY